MEMILADDKSDIADRCRAACMASLPDPEIKAKVWAEITDPNNSDSVYVRTSKMSGFYGHDQHDIVKGYFDKFYEILPQMHKDCTHKKFESFFHTMLPRSGEIRDDHIVKLMCLKQETPDNEKQFMNTLQDGIELLIRSKEIRALNQQ